jgi:fluoroacetyl-CoA thioesterase
MAERFETLDLRPGLRSELTWEVTPERTAAAVGHDASVGVLATPLMGLLAEIACARLLSGRLPPGMQHVGIMLKVDHYEATPVGFTITAKAVLTEVADRTLTFHVEMHDNVGKVGSVVHRRRLVDWSAFLERLERRKAQAAL